MSVTQGRKATRLASWAAALAVASALAVGTPVPVSAAAPNFTIDLPAGVACAGFDLRVEGAGDKRIMREFTDRNGNVVRLLSAGKGFTLTFTNLDTDESLTVQSNGSVERTTVSDGTSTVVGTGHYVLILFPTDIPAGPSTTLYVGQVVFTVDANGVFTLQSTSGTTTDICALLA
jgi:hypothetical protein